PKTNQFYAASWRKNEPRLPAPRLPPVFVDGAGAGGPLDRRHLLVAGPASAGHYRQGHHSEHEALLRLPSFTPGASPAPFSWPSALPQRPGPGTVNLVFQTYRPRGPRSSSLMVTV